MPHLLVALTAHGFGHVAQTAPVINTLRRGIPDMRLTLYTSIPRSLLGKRFEGEFELVAQSPDVGMAMKDALEVDAVASAAAYQAYHRDWGHMLEQEVRLLKSIAPDAILVNVPYRILAAAAEAKIPAVALCSLNWADIYEHFCASAPGAETILREMRAAYRSVRTFLQPAPSMPMADLENRAAIGPIARVGRDQRSDIRRRFGLNDKAKLIVVSLGGIATQLDPSRWPALPNIYWIVPAEWDPGRRDIIALESLHMDFIDVLRSADALITKPGYGSFVEAACNGVPVLYAPRRDWPEEAHLVKWLRVQGHCLAINREQLERGDFAVPLQEIFAVPPPPPLIPTGIDEAAAHLTDLLEGTKAR